MIELRRYVTRTGTEVFTEWFTGLKDKRARAKIAVRLTRLMAGNFGDCKPLADGVWELRIGWGPGYRVYYAMAGQAIVLLLCGGDKRKQAADIRRAIGYWTDYQERTRKQ